MWTMLAQIAQYVLRFGGHLIVARLLAPRAFALMLLVNTFLHGLQMFTDIGINASIIQHPDADDRRFLNTAWTIKVIRGALLWVVCAVLAYPYADFMEREVLTTLITVSGFSVMISGFNSTSLPIMSRHLDLKRLMAFRVGVQLASTIVMIGYALVSPTVWALVAGLLVNSVLRLAGSYLLFDAPPNRFELHRQFVRTIVAFGAWVFVNTLLGYLANSVDKYALGKVIQDDALLGCYHVAVNMGGIPFMVLVAVGRSVVFPMMGRSREAGIDLRRAYSKVKLPIFAAAGLAVSGLIATGPQLIQVLYKPVFWDAGWMIVPVAAGQWFRVLAIPPANAIFALGKIYWLSAANLSKLVGYALFVPALWRLGGVEVALWGFVAGESLGIVVYAVASVRNGLGFPWRDLALTILVAAVSLAGYSLRTYWVEAGLSPILVVLGVGALVSLPWLTMAPGVLREIRRVRRGA
jgi:O-antigen/teichoic acid export membrane protein